MALTVRELRDMLDALCTQGYGEVPVLWQAADHTAEESEPAQPVVRVSPLPSPQIVEHGALPRFVLLE